MLICARPLLILSVRLHKHTKAPAPPMHPPTATSTASSWDVFVAYASPDRESAKRVAASLEPFLRVFLDVDQLQVGDAWDVELREALDSASIVIVLLSHHTAAAFFERDELLRAIDRMRREPEKCAVVPVYMDGFSPTSPSLPYGLRPLQGFALGQESDLESLGRAVVTCLSNLRPDAIEVPTLSKGIVAHYERIDLEVQQLTSEQYRAIQQLKHLKRVRISGSAGSGKTLVALEKCARLATAGRRVMFLCHNPLLAEFATALVPNAGVYVTDFCGWIEATLAENPTGEWSHYFEPTGDQLSRFVQYLEASEEKFDAIVVDEAQDFRDEWWHAVEKALRPDAEATLYLFHDNKQSLLPRRGNYPITEPRIDLSRNCRNAGRVYELMRYFDTNAPEAEKRLSGLGQVSFTSFAAGEESVVLEAMVRQHCSLDRLQNTVLLWSGVETASS